MKTSESTEVSLLRPSGKAESRLLESALTLFSNKGYEGTSIREIIERAGVTRPVLYYYFRNKEDLLCKVVEATFADMRERFEETVKSVEGCRARLKALTREAFKRVEEHPDVVQLVIQVFFSPELQTIAKTAERHAHRRLLAIRAIMQDGLDTGELSGGDAQTLTLMYSGLVDIHAMARVRHREARLTPEFADGLVDIFMDGAGNKNTSRAPLISTFDFSVGSKDGH